MLCNHFLKKSSKISLKNDLDNRSLQFEQAYIKVASRLRSGRL